MLIAFLLFLGQAMAWTGQICAQYDVVYTDAEVGDLWTIDGVRHARGAKITMWDNTINQQVFSISPVHAMELGPNIGCREFTLANGHSYSITLIAWAKVNGNYIKVWPDTCDSTQYPANCILPPVHQLDVLTTPEPYSVNVTNTFVPQISTPTKLTWVAPVHAVWRLAAVAGYSLFRNNGGVTGKTYRIRHNDVQGDSECVGDGRLLNGVSGRKFMGAHEFGHCVAGYGSDLLAGDHGWLNSPQLADDKCLHRPAQGGGGLTRRNRLVMSMVEGTAHHYANVVWNEVDADPATDDDAEMHNLRDTDWNLLGPDGDSTVNDWLVDTAANPPPAPSVFSTNGCLWCFQLTATGSPATCNLDPPGNIDYTMYDGKGCYNHYLDAAENDGPELNAPVHMEGDVIAVTGSYVSAALPENHLKFCDDQARDGVTLETDNRATQIDYTRFLWDMYRRGMDLEDFFGIVVDADPSTWAWNNDGLSLSNPRNRMRDAAETAFPEWEDVAKEHGVHR